ncbi:hypothetical protein GQ457_07G005250 [Hibiscus cannabinus]
MVSGWRRAFCTSITNKQPGKHQQQQSNESKTPRFSSKFGFFSNPSTPRFQSQPPSNPPSSLPNTPKLHCKTSHFSNPPSSLPNTPKLHCKTSHFSNPSSFSLLKTTLRLSKGGRCGICSQSVKTGQGTAIFTAECSHSFHFPCIAAHFKKQQLLNCPVCSSSWKELPILSLEQEHPSKSKTTLNNIHTNTKSFRVYNDDEPLASPVSLSHFNSIPENDDVQEEFQGFSATPRIGKEIGVRPGTVEVRLLQETAMVAIGRSYESYVVVMKVQAPTATGRVKRAPIDLVTVLDISGGGERLQLVKRAMRLLFSLLNETDRLSIVVYSSSSKRLLPLKRMSSDGRRTARRIVDALGSNGQGMSVNDALKKAAKVLEDRREKRGGSILIFSEGQSQRNSSNHDLPVVSTTRLQHSDVHVHSIGLGTCSHAPNDDLFCKILSGLLGAVVQDVRLQLRFVTGSAPAEISSVYSLTTRPAFVGSNSVRIGDLHSDEERELLVELKVPVSSSGSHRVMSVRASHRDPFTQGVVHSRDQRLLIPRPPQSVRSSCQAIERLRNLHISTRAVAESRRLTERNHLSGAQHMLTSARALLMQSGCGSGSAEEFIRRLETELEELKGRRRREGRNNSEVEEEKGEALTPTSAWRAAERLAKVAIMRKHMNRVSDLHGFENARF